MKVALILVCGWLYVSLVEYAWHRWVLHSGNHAVHNAHHTAFFTEQYAGSRLLSVWALVAAAAHCVLAWLFWGVMPAAILALSVFSYLALLEFLHDWIHGHPEAWIARRHIDHHLLPGRNFNVFLPVWDFVFRTA